VSVALRQHPDPGGVGSEPSRPAVGAEWRAFYDQHLPLVYRLARRLGVAESEVGDVCQEVFLRVYRGLDGFRGEAQLSTWLYRIVLREVSRARRSRTLRRALLALLGRQPATRAVEPHARADARRELDRVLGRMKPKQRQVFVLFDLEELTLPQIAAIVGCPVETVRSRLRSARAALARMRRQDTLVSGGGEP
jgi:RNA polymerase sigma-70 factor (ECF subfamily)